MQPIFAGLNINNGLNFVTYEQGNEVVLNLTLAVTERTGNIHSLLCKIWRSISIKIAKRRIVTETFWLSSVVMAISL